MTIIQKDTIINESQVHSPKDKNTLGRSYTTYKKQQIVRYNSSFPIRDNRSNLADTIEKSKYILDLADDWDDEGSSGYSKHTWEKAIAFLLDYEKWLLKNFNIIMIIPNIFHGKEGGIDILWEKKYFRMLIRIDKEVNRCFFYADNLHRQTSEGEFEINNINYLMLPIPIND